MVVGDPHADALSQDQLRELIAAHGIVGLLDVHPAVHRFRLGDGRVLEMWDEGSDYGIFWELKPEAVRTEPQET